jgi:hypothetical protein
VKRGKLAMTQGMALRRAAWQGACMTAADLPDPVSPPPPAPRGGGCLIAAGLVLGPVVGLFLGQVSAGLVAGGVIGVLAAVVMALAEKKR